MLAGCCRIVTTRARSASLEIVLDLAPQLPPVQADERRIKQIVLNLLSNAIKFTPPGGRIVVAAGALASGEVSISVSDTGIGMKPEDVSVALEPFRQIDSALTRRFDGTGLGLPLVQRLVHLHCGSLTIESALNVGTVVTVKLPASRCSREVA